MFNNDLLSDVKFVVRKTDDESQCKRVSKYLQVIPAHYKFVLSISSPLFQDMFYVQLTETGDSIELSETVWCCFDTCTAMNSGLHSSLECLKTRRSGFLDDNIRRCSRFESVLKGQWDCAGQADGIDFTVDNDVMLYGLCLFGSEDSNYSVTLTIKKDGRNRALSKAGTFSSKLLQHTNGSYYGFEILFHSAVKLKKNTTYQIKALITGPPSWYGENGISTVVCSGVTFTFTTNVNNYGTGTEAGLFPEILFSVLA
ncbi:hypothetical protein ACROYT_G008655 [Oculina patagonica]